MKLLIAYDGSECADAALNDLRRAGLPPLVEAMVASVADVWPYLPETPPEPEDPTAMVNLMTPEIREARALVAEARIEAQRLAARAATHLTASFPEWKIEQKVLTGSPAAVLLQQAEQWQADLVLVGSHGRSGLGRLLFGSVSQKVLSYAHCSVRVARCPSPPSAGAARLIVGVDGSPDAAAAVHAVARRFWPAGSEIRVVAALDPHALTTLPVVDGVPVADLTGIQHIEKAAQDAAKELADAGWVAVPMIREGDPKRILVQEAQQWGADCIFLGAKGMSRLERFLMGSVSAAVAVRAHCSVEIVRPAAVA